MHPLLMKDLIALHTRHIVTVVALVTSHILPRCRRPDSIAVAGLAAVEIIRRLLRQVLRRVNGNRSEAFLPAVTLSPVLASIADVFNNDKVFFATQRAEKTVSFNLENVKDERKDKFTQNI